MNVITLASRKGGAGKSTLTAHLAACAHADGRRCLVIDADPQGSLTLWHSLRADGQPPLRNAARGIDRALAFAMLEGFEWIFIDTAPTMWVVVQEAIRAATLVVIPARPGFFDLNAVRETVATARERAKPYCVVLNAAPVQARRQGSAHSRAISRLSRQAPDPGLVGPDQSARRLRAHARRRHQRLRARARDRRRRRDRGAVVGDRALGRGDQRRARGRPRGTGPSGVGAARGFRRWACVP